MYQVGLPDGEYILQIAAFNKQGNLSKDAAMSEGFTVGVYTRDTELGYPFVYILVPGLIFLVIIIVVTVVMFKIVHEKRKRRVTYCKGEKP